MQHTDIKNVSTESKNCFDEITTASSEKDSSLLNNEGGEMEALDQNFNKVVDDHLHNSSIWNISFSLEEEQDILNSAKEGAALNVEDLIRLDNSENESQELRLASVKEFLEEESHLISNFCYDCKTTVSSGTHLDKRTCKCDLNQDFETDSSDLSDLFDFEEYKLLQGSVNEALEDLGVKLTGTNALNDQQKPFKENERKKKDLQFPPGIHSCPICSKAFPTKRKLKIHLSTHSLINPYSCSLCSKSFKTKDKLRNHEYIHSKPYVCPECTCAFGAFTKLKKHFEKHINGKLVHLCSICPKMFSRPSYLSRHQKIEHGIEMEENVLCTISQSEIPNDMFSSNLESHKNTAQALIRNQQSDTKSVNDNNNSENSEVSENVFTIKPTKCKSCSYTCNSQYELRLHMVEHGEEIKPYQCNCCYRTFKHPSQKVLHEYIHRRDKMFACPHCPHKYSKKGALTIHLRIHTGELPFECLYCKKKFRSKTYLVNHIRTHDETKKFKCQVCSKNFKTKDNLRVHSYTHTKRHKCPVCTKLFTSNFQVKQHLVKHESGALVFKCTECPQQFFRHANLKKHVKLEHKILQ